MFVLIKKVSLMLTFYFLIILRQLLFQYLGIANGQIEVGCKDNKPRIELCKNKGLELSRII
jgi:hypothetical protein